jgi:hypothetical protein
MANKIKYYFIILLHFGRFLSQTHLVTAFQAGEAQRGSSKQAGRSDENAGNHF